LNAIVPGIESERAGHCLVISCWVLALGCRNGRRFKTMIPLPSKSLRSRGIAGHLNRANEILITRRPILELNLQVRAVRFILE